MKLAAFNSEVHRWHGKRIVHADVLLRFPPELINVIENIAQTTLAGVEIPHVAATIDNCQEKVDNDFNPTLSLAHCVPANIKVSAGVARVVQRGFFIVSPLNQTILSLSYGLGGYRKHTANFPT